LKNGHVFSLAFFIVGILLIVFFDKQAQVNNWVFLALLSTSYFYFAWSWVKGGHNTMTSAIVDQYR
jgi:hypothetical protein